MTDRRCVICGNPLPPRHTRYCGPNCARIGENARARARRDCPPRPKPLHWITCPDCGREVYVHVKCIRCPDCQRAADSRHDAEHKRRKASGHVRAIGSTDLCERCGKPYTVAGGLQRYCPDCAPIVSAEHRRAASRRWNKAHYTTSEGKAAKNVPRRAKPPYINTCVICGKPFSATDIRQVCCSPDCDRQRLRAYWRERKKSQK